MLFSEAKRESQEIKKQKEKKIRFIIKSLLYEQQDLKFTGTSKKLSRIPLKSSLKGNKT
jgi:hypothetical protein